MAGRGKPSREACLQLANYWIEKGEFAKAEAELKKIKDRPKDFIYFQGQDLLGQVYAHQKNYDRAIEIYKALENEASRDYLMDAVLFHRAEVHELMGQREEALLLYKRLQEEFPQSFYGYEASQKVMKQESGK
jgi:tetratricopeptide (TPR) repeat protein